METQIHLIEQEAYSSILRAFKAQSDAITWSYSRSKERCFLLLQPSPSSWQLLSLISSTLSPLLLKPSLSLSCSSLSLSSVSVCEFQHIYTNGCHKLTIRSGGICRKEGALHRRFYTFSKVCKM
uniref:ENT domain-containing protein n=1 Tax=Brassica oleracea var. oleracea TaxID=109376 RepID=A0A0D3BI64_BRAOL